MIRLLLFPADLSVKNNKESMMLKNLFADRIFNKKLFMLAFPIGMQNLMLALVAAADALMLGRLNQDAVLGQKRYCRIE